MSGTATIPWNTDLRLVLADVDETIAEVYTPAEPAMIEELTSFLSEGRKLFLVTGGSLQRVCSGITDLLPSELRHDILISHCSGSEVWGFDNQGNVLAEPFYSRYEETFTKNQKRVWRQLVDQLIAEFGLRTHPVQPKVEFWAEKGREPLEIMFDDRGPQITLELVNAIDLTDDQLEQLPYAVPLTRGKYDLRGPIMSQATELLEAHDIPVTPRLGGTFAIDMAVAGVSKTTSIQHVLSEDSALATIGLRKSDVQNPHELEIWGDKFSVVNGGTDRHMCEAVDPSVRAIDFRQEDPAELPTGYNIVPWSGRYHLHHGLLEFLQSRHHQAG